MEGRRPRGNTEIGKLDKPLFGRKNVGPLDISMYYTLLMKIEESMKNLRHIDAYKVLWKFAKVLGYGMERPILAIPTNLDQSKVLGNKCNW